MGILYLAIVCFLGCCFVSSAHVNKYDEISRVKRSIWPQEEGQVEKDINPRFARAAGTRNDVGGTNGNGAYVATTQSSVSNEILYSESDPNSGISVQPMQNKDKNTEPNPADNNAETNETVAGQSSTSDSNNATTAQTQESNINNESRIISAIDETNDITDNVNGSNQVTTTPKTAEISTNATTVNNVTESHGTAARDQLSEAVNTYVNETKGTNDTQATTDIFNTAGNNNTTDAIAESSNNSVIKSEPNAIDNKTNVQTTAENVLTTTKDSLGSTLQPDANQSGNDGVDGVSNSSASNNSLSESSTAILPIVVTEQNLPNTTTPNVNSNNLLYGNDTANTTDKSTAVPNSDNGVNASDNITDANDTIEGSEEGTPEPEPEITNTTDIGNKDGGNKDDTGTVTYTSSPSPSRSTEDVSAVHRSTSITTRASWPAINETGNDVTNMATDNETNGQSIPTTFSDMTSLNNTTSVPSTEPTILWSPNSSDSKISTSNPDSTSFTATFTQPDEQFSTKSVSENKQGVRSTTSAPSVTGSTEYKPNTTVSYSTHTTQNTTVSSKQSIIIPSKADPSEPFEETKTEPTTEPESSTPEAKSSKPETEGSTTETEGSTPEAEGSTPEAKGSTPEAEDNTPEAEEEDKGESEPEDASPEGEGVDFGAFEEPGPDWPVAKKVWREAWPFHVYFFSVWFVLLGLYSCACVIRLWGLEHLLSRNYFLTLHTLVILVCILRATYLLVDAYNSNGTFPTVVDYFLYNTVFPCITSLFSILFYALLLATRVRILSRKVQKLGVLISIVAFHFVISVVTDLIVGLLSTAHVLIFICQSFFILWGLIMFIGYLIVFKKLYKGAISRQKNLTISNPDRKNSSIQHGGQSKESKHRYTFGLAVKVTFVSAFFGVAIVGFELYGMFGVFGILQADVKPQPWPWWTYHVIVRTLELLMCTSVCYVASQPLRYMARKESQKLYQYLLPCSACCCNTALDNSYDSSTMSMENVSETDHLSWLKKKNKKPSVSYPPHASEKYNDPDATLLVRKIRQNKPSMLVVEDGFVRIRREDEMLPPNQYELDSNSHSSQSSGLNNAVPGNEDGTGPNAVVNYNYTGDPEQIQPRENTQLGFSLDNYRLPSVGDNRESLVMTEVTDDTDIDIVVTDSEVSDSERDTHAQNQVPPSPTSNKSGDIFRPLSMIDLAASMESELERAFHYTDNTSTKCVYNKSGGDNSKSSDVTSDICGDSDFDQSKSNSRLIRSPIRRSKSEENPVETKTKMFANNRYYSVSNVEDVGKDEENDIEAENSTYYPKRKRTF